jgi:hypothetical protein
MDSLVRDENSSKHNGKEKDMYIYGTGRGFNLYAEDKFDITKKSSKP